MESLIVTILQGALLLVLGVVLGVLGSRLVALRRLRQAERDAERILGEATTKEKEVLLAAKEEALRVRNAAETESRERRAELQRQERRLQQKEENLDRKAETMERRERNLTTKENELETLRQQVEELRRLQLKELEQVSGLSSAEAKDLLLQAIESEVKEDAVKRFREVEAQVTEEAEARAREVIATVLHRLASDVVSESTVSVVPIPSDEMKGRIIGKEGRNIRALEAATGVDLIIDDTPDVVTLSGFDPVRREVARLALTKLVTDGRIHPARIEEVVEKTRQEVEVQIKAEGERAALKADVSGLHPELIKLLGRLKFRYSYGQNVLQHSLEVAHLAAMMAEELGADVEVARRAGLLHDIGKAVDHEVEGPHALIGADLAHRFGKSPRVEEAIAGHHGEREAQSVEAALVAAADALSGGRPGARRDSLDRYLKRLEALESIANSFPGVEKSFAIQAGREVRVIVKPEDIDDLAAFRLARDLVKKIEEDMEYPGQIKVTVVRETRAIEYAR